MQKTSLWRLLVIFGLFSTTAYNRSPVLSLPATAGTITPDPLVVEMLAQVQPGAANAFTGSLSGEWPALVENAPYTFSSRATPSGVPVQKATLYVYEHMQALGLSPAFDNWSYGIYSGRNVVGTIPGTTQADEIVLLTAHLDDSPWSGLAPGADDNASGSTGVLLAADILSEYSFARTVRFVLFTGEEQGLLGSKKYATDAFAAEDNIVAVINLDMIAWDRVGGPVLRLHIQPGSAKQAEIAGLFSDVVSAYGLDLEPVIDADGQSSSDHASFWGQGYPAILAIEDDLNDFNRNYHSNRDRLAQLNLEYFTSFVKAAVGSTATLAVPGGYAAGESRAQLGPPAAMQWSDPAEVASYTLELTNTGGLPDTYLLSISGNTWATDCPAQVGPLDAGASTELIVTVSIPPQAAGGSADVAALTVVSKESGAQVDGSELTTVVHWNVVYLPLIRR